MLMKKVKKFIKKKSQKKFLNTHTKQYLKLLTMECTRSLCSVRTRWCLFFLQLKEQSRMEVNSLMIDFLNWSRNIFELLDKISY